MNNEIAEIVGITPEKAEIIGLLCAEGSYQEYFNSGWEYYRNRKKYYFRNKKRSVYLQFANYDKKLLYHFKKLIMKIYSYNAPISFDRVRIFKRDVIKDLLRYTLYGHLRWNVPKEVIKGIRKVKIKFIRGYFDGDGTASNTIRIFSNNKDALKQVSSLLNSLFIETTFNGPIIRKNREPSYYIYVRRKNQKKFLDLINPISKIPHKKVL